MQLNEATQFVNDEFLPIWSRWSETLSFYEKQKWIDLFRETTLDGARRCVDRYYDSSDFTMQRPKRHSVKKYMPSNVSGGHDFAWIQNTSNGKFYPLYYPKSKDREKILIHWFKEHHPTGNWLVHKGDEKTYEQLEEYRKKKDSQFKADLAKLSDFGEGVEDFCKKYDIPITQNIKRASGKKPLWEQVKEVLGRN
jgi:hypothetical protein